jgi:hypothetical protein
MTIEALSGLEYTDTCLKAGMRVYPAVQTGFPRVVLKGEAWSRGYLVAEGVSAVIDLFSSQGWASLLTLFSVGDCLRLTVTSEPLQSQLR